MAEEIEYYCYDGVHFSRLFVDLGSEALGVESQTKYSFLRSFNFIKMRGKETTQCHKYNFQFLFFHLVPQSLTKCHSFFKHRGFRLDFCTKLDGKTVHK